MLKTTLIIAVPALALGLGLACAKAAPRCAGAGCVAPSGGVVDRSDRSAPTEIRSRELTSLSAAFLYDPRTGVRDRSGAFHTCWPPVARGEYELAIGREGEAVRYRARYRGDEPGESADASGNATAEDLRELEALVRREGFARANGFSKVNSALGNHVEFSAAYASGEKISIYARGGASTVVDGWGPEGLLGFFAALAERDGKRIAPLPPGQGRITRFSLFWSASPEARARGVASYRILMQEAGGEALVSLGAYRADRTYVEREGTLPAGAAGIFRDFVDRRELRRLSSYSVRRANSGEVLRLSFEYEDGERVVAEARGPGALPEKSAWDEAWAEELLREVARASGLGDLP